MKIDVYAYTDKGDKSVNEDSFTIQNDETRCVAVVCDGLGGHGHGEIASKIAVEEIEKGLFAIEELEHAAIYRVIAAVNQTLCQRQRDYPEWGGMRTTVVGCAMGKEGLYYFNVGDSRFYFFHNGSLSKMTRDHSVPRMLVDCGSLSFREIRLHPDRPRLLKCLGEETLENLASVYEPIAFQPGDAFLLCSDGFWEFVLEEEMEIDLSKAENSEAWVKFMLVRLYTRMTGNNDNYTVIGGIVR